MPVLATYFSVRRGRDPFFKFFMRTIFPKQVKDYEEKFGIRFIGWFNVAHGWDFDNVILLDLPDYATLDKLEADEATRALGHRAGEWIFERHHSMFLRERMGPDLEYHPETLPDQKTEATFMDSHNDLLGELASDAALERSDFIVQATEQLRRFLDHHKDRIAVLGGLTLIDDEPDYLSIAPDLSFRSRSRYLDDITGEWVSETEVIESASELVELYNPADVYAAFAEAAREAAGMPAEPTAEGDLLEVSGISPDEGVSLSEDPYAAAADSWAAGQPISLSEDDDESAARRLYDLSLEYQERSQRSEARLLDEFEGASAGLVSVIGDMIIVDDDDERLSLTTNGFRAEVIPEDSEDEWRTLSGSDQLVEFYDPTDVFGDLADALAEAFPAVAPELQDTSANGTAEAAESGAEAAEGGADGEATTDAGDDAEDRPTA